MENQLEHLLGRLEKARAMPADQQERYAMAIAQLEKDIDAARRAAGMDSETVGGRIGAALLGAGDRISRPAVCRAIDGINKAYSSGSRQALDLAIDDLCRATRGEAK